MMIERIYLQDPAGVGFTRVNAVSDYNDLEKQENT